MSAPTFAVDGSQQYGTPTITTVTGAVAYKLNNLKITRPLKEAEDFTINGDPQRWRGTAMMPELTADCQLASSSTVLPIWGDTFALTVDVAYGSEVWIIKTVDVDRVNDAGAIRTVPITARKSISGSAPTLS